MALAPVPALPDTERRTSYNVTTTTAGPFDVGFDLYADGADFQNWVEVWVNGVKTPAGWTLSSPSGALAGLSRPISNARITFDVALVGTIPAPVNVQIVGARRPRRLSQFGNAPTARDFNRTITDLEAAQRELFDKLTRVPQGVPGDVIVPFPKAAARANKLVGFDGAGGLVVKSPSEIALDFAAISVTGGAGLSGGGALNASQVITLNLGSANTWTAAQTFPNNSGIRIKDTDGSHTLGLVLNSNLTTNRALTLITGDADRSLTLAADATIGGLNTGDQTIQLTGDVTGTGTGSFATAIAAKAVTNAKLADMAASRIKGAVGAGAPQDLTPAQVTGLLDVFGGDAGAGGTKGLVPAPAAGDAAAGKYLRADGVYAVPPGTGGGGGGGSITDGDKGDITVSGTGAIWTVDNNAITLAKLVDFTASQRLFGRNSALGGDPEEVSASQVLDWLGSTRGSLLYRGAGGWAILAPGNSGDRLTSGGAGADPSWAAPTSGDVSAAAAFANDNRVIRSDGVAKGVQASGLEITDTNVLRPVTDDGAAFGDTTHKISDLFLANGAVLDFNNGDIQIIHSTNNLQFSGAFGGYTFDNSLFTISATAQLGVGSQPWAALYLKAAGAVDFGNSAGLFGWNGTTFTGQLGTKTGVLPPIFYIRQHAAYNLANVATVQKLFNGSANGAVNLPAGTYFFEALISLSAMSATSGSSAFSLVGGTATIANVLMASIGIDGAAATAAALTGSFATSAAFPASMQTPGTATAQQAYITGTFEVTAAGTVIPSIQLVTASAAQLAIGSYFRCTLIGQATDVVMGEWS